jgi:hypothetical protein
VIAVLERFPLALNLNIGLKLGTRLRKFHSILNGATQTLTQEDCIHTLILILGLHTDTIEIQRLALLQIPEDAENTETKPTYIMKNIRELYENIKED